MLELFSVFTVLASRDKKFKNFFFFNDNLGKENRLIIFLNKLYCMKT